MTTPDTNSPTTAAAANVAATPLARYGRIIALVAMLGAALVLILILRGRIGAEASLANAPAVQTAAGEVRVLSGGIHTVQHTVAPLPSASAPRPDGRPMLVWFSGTWCTSCSSMESFAMDTAARFKDRVVFTEKSVDHDTAAASRYTVRGTPTFVLIDAKGIEVGRFFYQPNAEGFAQSIDTTLKKAGF